MTAPDATDRDTAGDVEALADVFEGHAYTYPDSFCECGHYVGGYADWRDHMAAVLLASDWFAARDATVAAEAKAAGWAEGAAAWDSCPNPDHGHRSAGDDTARVNLDTARLPNPDIAATGDGRVIAAALNALTSELRLTNLLIAQSTQNAEGSIVYAGQFAAIHTVIRERLLHVTPPAVSTPPAADPEPGL